MLYQLSYTPRPPVHYRCRVEEASWDAASRLIEAIN